MGKGLGAELGDIVTEALREGVWPLVGPALGDPVRKTLQSSTDDLDSRMEDLGGCGASSFTASVDSSSM